MKKMSTLYQKNPDNLGLVINKVNQENRWVINGEAIPTRKFDGTACAVINGELYKRYDGKKGRQVPLNSIACQNPDEITGHWPHWVQCNRNNPADKWHFIAFDDLCQKVAPKFIDNTYELCGEKIQGNPEKIKGFQLIPHGCEILNDCFDLSFNGLNDYLSDPCRDIEGIVFYNRFDDRMCKIRKSDFGIKR